MTRFSNYSLSFAVASIVAFLSGSCGQSDDQHRQGVLRDIQRLDGEDQNSMEVDPSEGDGEIITDPGDGSEYVCGGGQAIFFIADGVDGDGELHAWMCDDCGPGYDDDGSFDLSGCYQDDAFLVVCSDSIEETELCSVCYNIATGVEESRTCGPLPEETCWYEVSEDGSQTCTVCHDFITLEELSRTCS